MSTLLIDASPKKRFSNSAYFMGFSSWFMKSHSNKCHKIKLPLTEKKYDEVFSLIKQVDKVVLATPLYVDGLPSHVLKFLFSLEKYCKEENVKFKMYVISNCGFFEGHQTQNLLSQVQIWCKRANIEWNGGIGIGGGEMLGFLRINLVIYAILEIFYLFKELFLQITTSNYSLYNFIESLQLKSLAIKLGVFLLFNLFAAITLIRLGYKVKAGKEMKIKYTGISFCPKFLFVIFADVYWFLRLCIVNRRLPQRAFDKEPINKWS